MSMFNLFFSKATLFGLSSGAIGYLRKKMAQSEFQKHEDYYIELRNKASGSDVDCDFVQEIKE